MSKEPLELFSEQSNWGYGYFSGGSLQFQFCSLYSSKNPERKRITISTKKYSAAQPICNINNNNYKYLLSTLSAYLNDL